MNRERKFRIWDTKENKWFKPVYEAYKGNLLDASITLSGIVAIRTLEGTSIIEFQEGRYIISDYIGLEDANGVPIYEGDLLKINNCGNESIEEVSFNIEDSCCWATRYSGFTIFNEGEVFIAGNIYENPELKEE